MSNNDSSAEDTTTNNNASSSYNQQQQTSQQQQQQPFPPQSELQSVPSYSTMPNASTQVPTQGSLSSGISAGNIPQGQGTDFVKKLFQMLEENRFSTIVRWTDSGDSFMITDTNEFTKDVLPCYFKHSNFSSFVRQLNKYDFHKVKLSQEIRQRYQLENVWEFKHPDFNRFDKSSLENIKRKVPAKKDTNEVITNNSCVPITSYRKLEDRVNFLEKENISLNKHITTINTNLTKLNQKYNTLVSNLLTSKDINMSFSRSIEILSKGLTQLGVQLPNIELPHLDYLQDDTSTTSTTNPVKKQTTDNIHELNHQNLNHLNNQNNANNNNGHKHTNHTHVKIEENDRDDISDNDIKQQTPTNQALSTHARIMNRPQGSYIHVLLVEDDDICIQLCRKFLMKYGCTVVVVTDGLSAISAVEQVKFDLVLMDIVMPNLDGASATSVIRSFDSDTPIIAMTGNYQRNDLVTYLNHGMTDILAKPFTKDDLYMILEKHNIHKKFPQPVPMESPQQPSNQPPQQLSPQQQQHSPQQHHYPSNPTQHQSQQDTQQGMMISHNANTPNNVQQQQQQNQQALPRQTSPQNVTSQRQTPSALSARFQQKNGGVLLNTSASPGQLLQDMDLNVIPTVHDDLLTPTLLESTGLTPEPSGIQRDVTASVVSAGATSTTGKQGQTSALQQGAPQSSSQQRQQDQMNSSDMDLLGVSDAEFRDMFKRRRIM